MEKMGGEDREEAHKKLKLGTIGSSESASNQMGGEDQAHKKLQVGPIGSDQEEVHKKLKLGRIISGESASNQPFFNPKVVFFRHSLPNQDASLQVLKPKLAQFGSIVYGPTPLAFTNDVAYLVYESQDGANKAVDRMPVEDDYLILGNTNDVALYAFRQFVLLQFTPQLEKLKAHPASSIVYVSNVHYETTRDELKDFFSEFGEIVEVPLLFELEPEAAWWFCLLVYKSGEGARHALKQPIKNFKPHDYPLYCSADIETPVQLYQESMLDDLKLSVELAEHFHLKRQQAAAEMKALAKNTPLQENHKTASALNDVVAAAEKLNKAADLAWAAAKRFNRASSFMETALERTQGSAGRCNWPCSTSYPGDFLSSISLTMGSSTEIKIGTGNSERTWKLVSRLPRVLRRNWLGRGERRNWLGRGESMKKPHRIPAHFHGLCTIPCSLLRKKSITQPAIRRAGRQLCEGCKFGRY